MNYDKNIIEKLMKITPNKYVKNIYNYNIFLIATKICNKILLNYTINNLFLGYKDNIIMKKNYKKYSDYKNENYNYPIDYLVMRIINHESINYSGFMINKEEIEIDIYYLLSLLHKIDYNFKNYCSYKSFKFIDDILKVRIMKQNVFTELLYMPPINGLYCGGSGYHKSMINFKKLVYDES
jgi:hypothetical protein